MNSTIPKIHERMQKDFLNRISMARIEFADDQEYLEDALKEIRFIAEHT